MVETENIRLLNSGDTEKFRKLRLESLSKDSLSWLSTLEEEGNLPYQSFANKILYAVTPPIFGYYGFFSGKNLLAYAQLASGYWNKKKHIANLYDVCVSVQSRRQSVGTKLVKYIIEKVRTVSYIEELQLRVNSGNPGGISFYEKLGFKKIAVFKNAVKENDGSYQDELVYTMFFK